MDDLISSNAKLNRTLNENSIANNHVKDFVVVMTGATGFLGGHILYRLGSDDRIRETHCIALPSDDSGKAHHVKA